MNIFNLDFLREELDRQDWEEDDFSGDMERRSVYLGSVFSLLPSGKYYASFAHSNVSAEQAFEDERWYKQAEDELADIGCGLEHGEGDPCDLYATEYRSLQKLEQE